MSSVLQRAARGATTNGQTLALAGNTAQPSTMVVTITHNGATVTLTDSQSNTYTSTGYVSIGGGIAVEFYTAPVATSAALTITVAVSGGNVTHVQAAEVSGLAVSPWVTPISSASTGSGTSHAVGPVTPPTDGSFLSYVIYVDATGSITPPTSFTENLDASGYYFADFIQTTAAAITPTATNGGAPTFGYVYLGVFKGAAAAGAAHALANSSPLASLVNGGLVS